MYIFACAFSLRKEATKTHLWSNSRDMHSHTLLIASQNLTYKNSMAVEWFSYFKKAHNWTIVCHAQIYETHSTV